MSTATLQKPKPHTAEHDSAAISKRLLEGDGKTRAKLQVISFVIPVHNEQQNAPLLYHEIMTHVRKLPFQFEFIYIDDGSQDDSVQVIEELAKHHRNIKLIELSRNFGKEAAVSAGLHAAHGDAALILDADFQHPPTLIADFIAKWQAGADVIIGVRKFTEGESWFKRFSSDLFYKLLKPISHTDIIPHATDFRLLDYKVIRAFRELSERNRMTRGLIDWLGFKRDFVHFTAAERKHGNRSYSYRKLFQLAMNAFTGYSLLPLRVAGYLGLLTILWTGPVSLLLYVETYVMKDPWGWGITNIVLLALFMLFLIGLVLACLGLVAMYIAKIHAEVSGRPLYVVRKEVVSDNPALTDEVENDTPVMVAGATE